MFCRRSCRQRDYEARKQAADLGLTESELVVTRRDLDQLRDALYALAMAVEDVQRDVEDAASMRDLTMAIEHLVAAAKPAIAAGDVAG